MAELSSELTSVLTGLGFTPEDLVGLSQGTASAETEAQVFVGKDPKDIRITNTRPVSEYKNDLMRKNPGDLPEVQRRLWEGGFYDTSIDWEDIRQGDYDDDTRTAWQRAVERAAAFYSAGENRTLDEVIDMARLVDEEGNFLGPGGTGRGGGRGGGTGQKPSPISTTVTHPDDLKTVAMKVSAQALGRGWNQEQLDRFAATFQQMERAAQSAAQVNARTGGSGTQAPNPAVAARQMARSSDPVAAGATDTVNAYGLLLEAMEGLGAP